MTFYDAILSGIIFGAYIGTTIASTLFFASVSVVILSLTSTVIKRIF
jgi:hypothetical protein